jgi:hypothetical protein
LVDAWTVTKKFLFALNTLLAGNYTSCRSAPDDEIRTVLRRNTLSPDRGEIPELVAPVDRQTYD